VADIGSGLVDSTCPWLPGAPPAWLAGEPAAVQAIADGADLITFSGDKLLGGPQAGIIAGRADLVEQCLRHPLARALRPGGLVLAALQTTALTYLDKRVVTDIAFWRMVATPIDELRARAESIVDAIRLVHPSARVESTEALPGAGSAPGVTMPSVGVVIDGDLLKPLRQFATPVIARSRDDRTSLDLRSIDPVDDQIVIDALRAAGG
ncbi:MAG: L-seryl-tRNA(Ser) seleniumtransferase, partial [Ilumatobacter sp.]